MQAGAPGRGATRNDERDCRAPQHHFMHLTFQLRLGCKVCVQSPVDALRHQPALLPWYGCIKLVPIVNIQQKYIGCMDTHRNACITRPVYNRKGNNNTESMQRQNTEALKAPSFSGSVFSLQVCGSHADSDNYSIVRNIPRATWGELRQVESRRWG